MKSNLPVKTGKKQNSRPQLYKPGISGNPAGRPKGSPNYTTVLEQAIKDYEAETGKNLLKRYIERAFTSDRVLVSIIKKLIPDKQQLELEVEQQDIYRPYANLTGEELIAKMEEIIKDAKNKKDHEAEVAKFWKPENKGKTYY
jgi:hypothetical protein